LRALFAHIAYPKRLYEPCVGQGAIQTYVEERSDCGVLTNDIGPTRSADFHEDARLANAWPLHTTWCITNPPFNQIDAIMEMAVTHYRNAVTLARLSFLEPTEARRPLFDTYPPKLVIVLPRYCFRLNDQGKRQTDSVTCTWVGWGPDVPKKTVIWTAKEDAGIHHAT
jgi:hypothetical protein